MTEQALLHKEDAPAQNRQMSQDITALLQITRKVFPEILTLNLTKGTYHMVSYHSGTTLGTPRDGKIDDMINIRLNGVIDLDRERFREAFSYDALKKVFIDEGKESISLTYRRPGKDGKRFWWFETTAMRQDNVVDNDILLVAVSRSIDQQKAEEAHLKERLWLQAEEIRVTTGRMRRAICYYDIPTKTLTVPEDYAKKYHIAQSISNYPASIKTEGHPNLPDTLPTLYRFYDSILQGDPTGSCELAFIHPEQGIRWKHWEFAMVYDRNGKPSRAVIFVEDITSQRLQANELQKTKENEQVLRLIAQHSDRTICYYDVKKQISRVWDPNTCARCKLPHLCEHSLQAIIDNGSILPESVDVLRDMFRDIHNGSPNGSMKLRVKGVEKSRWFDLQYSTIFDENNAPMSALISHKDITEQYEHELTYLHHVHSVQASENHLGTLELDLDADRIESQGGKMIPPDVSVIGTRMTDFSRHMVTAKMLEENYAEGLQFFSSEYLISQYAAGNHHLEQVWQMRFRSGLGWVRTTVTLMTDPYTGHKKAFLSMTDITQEKTAQLEAQFRSERDSMTGLLNRAAAEAQIRRLIADRENAGILLLLDLDDLKRINDTLGHAEGDRAILGVAQTMKTHFRDSDVIARIGGDEFLIFLVGAAENQAAISTSLNSLLRKLAGIAIGINNQKRIHCSIGCAVQTAEANTFEALYKQADTALYHIKRGSKNNFAFFAPEMLQADYRFQTQRLQSLRNIKKLELAELPHLLSAISNVYQLVLSMNLSTNDYFLLDEIENGVFSALPSYGIMDDFVNITLQMVHPEDVSDFMQQLSRESLLQAYTLGEKGANYRFRFQIGESYRLAEATVFFYTNSGGDVCDFTLVHWAD